MTGVRIVHAADIHLDSPLRGLGGSSRGRAQQLRRRRDRREEPRPVGGRGEGRVRPDLGDIYDGDWPDYNTGRFFAEQMAS